MHDGREFVLLKMVPVHLKANDVGCRMSGGGRFGILVKYVHDQPALSVAFNCRICESVRRLGYGIGKNIRLYGKEFEVISDPFPEAGGIIFILASQSGSPQPV